MRSTDSHVGKNTWRIRLGIDHPGHKDRVTGHVLGNFKADEQEEVRYWLRDLADEIETIFKNPADLKEGMEALMTNMARLKKGE